MTHSHGPDDVATLQDRVETQREAIAQLRAALAPAHGIGRTALGFSPQEQVIVELLLRGGVVTHERISQRLYGARHGEGAAAPGIVKVHVFHIRRKLEGEGVAIENVYGLGYRMADDQKRRLRAALAREMERA
jgi:DNA-binding response OmpR family regulator